MNKVKFTSFADAAMRLYKEFEADTHDMDVFWTAAGLLFCKDNLLAWADNGDYAKIHDALLTNMPVFRDCDTTGEGFVGRLCDLYNNGAFTDENGNKTLHITQNGNGMWDLGIRPDNAKLVADKMEVSEAVVCRCLLALLYKL